MDHRALVLDEASEFRFECHGGLACFGKCCRDINIFLSPYDVLRMKNYLGLSSGEFLEKYTLRVPVHSSGFSFVQIKMSEEDDLKCPFVTQKGCRVYPERPWACRIAPVDIREGGKYSFIFESSRCHGLNEAKAQTIKDWLRDQGLEIYTELEQGFSELPQQVKLTGDRETDEKFSELFFMACYDLDKFRSFLVSNPLLSEVMDTNEKLLERRRQDDIQLMKWGFRLLSSGPKRIKDILNVK